MLFLLMPVLQRLNSRWIKQLHFVNDRFFLGAGLFFAGGAHPPVRDG